MGRQRHAMLVRPHEQQRLIDHAQLVAARAPADQWKCPRCGGVPWPELDGIACLTCGYVEYAGITDPIRVHYTTHDDKWKRQLAAVLRSLQQLLA